MAKHYDVIIIGGGISGTALLYTLSKYTDIPKIALFEKHDDYAQVSSHYTQNSQTLHFGDIETNYTFDKAARVSKGAMLVANYLDQIKEDNIYIKPHKMVLGVGKKEVAELRQRYKDLKSIFPNNKLLERDDIAKLEPAVVKGRSKREPIVAYYSSEGYTVDYYRLAVSFAQQALEQKKKDIDVFLGRNIDEITPHGKGYKLRVGDDVFTADTVVSDAGAMSLRLAKKMGYGKHLSVVSVAGNFFRGPNTLNGKVYTVQNKKLPFAAVHGDPDVRGGNYTRFGPSAKVLISLERRNPKTIWDFFASVNYSLDGILSYFAVASDWTGTSYILRNMLYDLPFIGERLFAKNAQKIVPSIKRDEIKIEKGYGATRPQIIDTVKKEFALGEARVKGKNIIFNITPSPGASTCLQNARKDTHDLMEFFGGRYTFHENTFDKDLLHNPQRNKSKKDIYVALDG